ncbi:hypothetical protein BDQ17DRAFT_1428687 [Cyathus striatus]|nr:hypothetical protein BDQ17DRAFT_1428687 [Cyathus striatus]
MSIYPLALRRHPGMHMDADSTYSLLSNVNIVLLVLVNQLNILNIDILSPPLPVLSSKSTGRSCTSTASGAHAAGQLYNGHAVPFVLHISSISGVLGATEVLRVLDLKAHISVPLSSAPSLLPASSPDLPLNDKHPVLPYLTHLTLCMNNLPEALGSMILLSLHMLSIDDLDGISLKWQMTSSSS